MRVSSWMAIIFGIPMELGTEISVAYVGLINNNKWYWN